MPYAMRRLLFSPPPHPALEAYERLCCELGLALRECGRGRERLLDTISPPRLNDDSDPDGDPFSGDSGGIPDDLPRLASDGRVMIHCDITVFCRGRGGIRLIGIITE